LRRPKAGCDAMRCDVGSTATFAPATPETQCGLLGAAKLCEVPLATGIYVAILKILFSDVDYGVERAKSTSRPVDSQLYVVNSDVMMKDERREAGGHHTLLCSC